MGVAQLIEVRKRRVTVGKMAAAMGVNRTTVWRNEETPAQASADFWVRYASALRSLISPQAKEAIQDLDLVSEAMLAGVAA